MSAWEHWELIDILPRERRMEINVKMSWSNAIIPYFTLKYLLPLEVLLVSSYGPKFIDRAYKHRVTMCGRRHTKWPPMSLTSWYPEAGYATPPCTLNRCNFYIQQDTVRTTKAWLLRPSHWKHCGIRLVFSWATHTERGPSTVTSRTVASHQPASA